MVVVVEVEVEVVVVVVLVVVVGGGGLMQHAFPSSNKSAQFDSTIHTYSTTQFTP